MSELEQPTTNSTYKSDAPFNSAVDCLMRISRILQRIEKISVEYTLYSDISGIKLNAGQAQHIKARLVKQLYVQAIPLMSKNAKENILRKINNIKLHFSKSYNRTGNSSVKNEIYNVDVDNELDMVVIDIEEDLQSSNFFMPPKKIAGRAILRH